LIVCILLLIIAHSKLLTQQYFIIYSSKNQIAISYICVEVAIYVLD